VVNGGVLTVVKSAEKHATFSGFIFWVIPVLGMRILMGD